MKSKLVIIVAVAATLLLGVPSWADWNPGDGHKMHYPQLPDEAGWDVNATQPIVLADDWQCSETGWVKDIHFWGSWLHGQEGQISGFIIRIFDDIPASPPDIPYSRPGNLLWEEVVTNFIPRPIDPTTSEGWYDPSTGQALYPDHTSYFQYNVFLPQSQWFWQEQGKIYWLSISAMVAGTAGEQWGWKSSIEHFNDDAVWSSDPALQWIDLYEPPDFTQSLDLSFVITGGADQLDFGDAPEDALAYPTLGVTGLFPTCINVLVAGWVQHTSSSAYFGPLVDLETDGNAGTCPSFTPNNYDQDECFNDGDAGLIVPEPFTIQGPVGGEFEVPCPNSAGTPLGFTCQTATWGPNIDIRVTNATAADAYVNLLVDWNEDGQWAGVVTCPGGAVVPEHVLVNFVVPSGYVGPLSVLAPPAFTIGPNAGYVWARFSITDTPVVTDWNGEGTFNIGESEDYLLLIDQEQIDLDYGDAPEDALAYPSLGVIGSFPTCINVLVAGWVQHMNSGAWFGPLVDLETDGNAGTCPLFTPNNYDQDECFRDNDAGLIVPEPFTITGPVGGEVETPCPTSAGTPLGLTCQTATWGPNIDIDVTNGTALDVFVNLIIDWNQDGKWGGVVTCPGGVVVPEHVLVNFVVPAGYVGALSGLAPPAFTIGPNAGYVWARFSITDTPVVQDWNGEGAFDIGESEDYLLLIDQEQIDLDYGDAPDFVGGPSYATMFVNNGARHVIVPGVYLGSGLIVNPDPEPDGQQDANALGDDNDGNDDEDGVVLTSAIYPGGTANIDVTASVAGYLWAWFDFAADGTWLPATDQIFAAQPLAAGLNNLSFGVPAAAVPGTITFARFRFVTSNGAVISYNGLASDGEVEDYEYVIEEPPGPTPKWMQPPHGPGEGFDAVSNIGVPAPGVKWEQLPNPQWSGIHAHDSTSNGTIILADDWLCEGGVVTDFHWWGTVENPGGGIRGFLLSIHNNDPAPCLPLDPPIWQLVVPIGSISVTPTGVFNTSGLEIIRYDYDLPQADWFFQEQGQTYWFNVSAVSLDPSNPYVWLWQESNRTPTPILCPASQYLIPPGTGWQWVVWPLIQSYSDMAFRVTSRDLTPDPSPNVVVADDFISDGRPIEALKWWGSYFDEQYAPDVNPVEPYVLDGWFISFHHTSPGSKCPPDAAAGDSPTVLGVYFAPASAVQFQNMGYSDCLGHLVYEYYIDFTQCCLICSEVDPRNNSIPAQDGAFRELRDVRYWLDIQAVTGIEWLPPTCTPTYTGHLPSPNTPNGDFWGWHTSPVEKLRQACVGRIIDTTPYPPNCWQYGGWFKQPWLCTAYPDDTAVNMSFELLTTADLPPIYLWLGSMGEHTGITPDLAVPVTPGPGVLNVEPRVQSPIGLPLTYVKIHFNNAMDPSVNGTNVTPLGGLGGATATANLDPVDPSTVLITFNAPVVDEDCYVFDLAGLLEADLTPFGTGGEDTDFCLCFNEADVDGSGTVNTGDKNLVVSVLNFFMPADMAANLTADIDRSGTVNTGDKNLVVSVLNFFHSVATPCP